MINVASLELVIEEVIGIEEDYAKTISSKHAETIAVTESASRMMSFDRTFEETIHVAESRKKIATKLLTEEIATWDALLRNCGGILNNIFVRSGAIGNIAEFEKLVKEPPGYANFIDFKVGEYDYEEALVRIRVESKTEQAKPSISNLTIHVDIPDTDDRGTATITDTNAATKVYYNKQYYNPPEVNVVLIGGTTGNSGTLTPYIISTDQSDSTGRYFEVEIRDGSLNRVTGSISWFAKGY